MFFAGIQADRLDDMGVSSPFLACLEADGANDPLATSENFRRRIALQDELILWRPLVLQASGLAAVGERWQRAGVQALAFERAVAGSLGLIANCGHWREVDFGQVGLDDV